MQHIEYTVNDVDIFAFYEFNLKYHPKYRESLHRHRAVYPGVLIIAGILSWYFMNQIKFAINISILGILWGIAIPMILEKLTRRNIQNTLIKGREKNILGNKKIYLTEEELIEKTNEQENKYRWEEILRIETTENHVFIYLSPEYALTIPLHTLPKEKTNQFVKQIKKYIDDA